MKKQSKRIRPKTGDVVAIPPSDGRFACGRLLNDASIAIYDRLFEELPTIEQVAGCGIRFFTGLFDTAIRTQEWPRIGNIPGQTDDEDWAPPCYIFDELTEDSYEIYDRGKIRPATLEEIKGIEEQVMRYPEHLIEEIERQFRQRRARKQSARQRPKWKK